MIALISWLGVLTISLASAGQVSSHTPRPIWSWSGRWIGEAQIIVTWCQQKTLTFDITIADGNVSDGRIGDATVKSGKMHWNRSILGNTDYVIEAALEGDIVAAEHIRRKSIKFLVNDGGDRLAGGFHTSGWHIGGKRTMVMSGTKLTLRRAERVY